MPVEIEKLVVLLAVLAPVALSTPFVLREFPRYIKRQGNVSRLVVPVASATASLILVATLLGPPFNVIYRRVDLSSLPKELGLVGIALLVSLGLALSSYLIFRPMQGKAFNASAGAAPVLAGIAFLMIQFFAVEDPRVGLPEPLVVKTPDGVAAANVASIEQVADNLNFVTSLTSDSKGRIIFTEFRSGEIWILQPKSDGSFKKQILAKVPLPALKLLVREQGLWHADLNPEETHLYVAAIEATELAAVTKARNATSRVVRFPYDDGKAGPMEVVLSGLPAGGEHSGGALKFGPDGSLYLSIGDGGGAELARPDTSPPLRGSILRFTPEGQIPEGNPFASSPVYATGFRNPYGIAFNQDSGQMYATDNGPLCCDRVLRVTVGGFHGWPKYGQSPDDTPLDGSDPALVLPLIVTGKNDRFGPTQIIWYGGDRYGPEFKGNLFFGTFLQADLRRIVLSEDGLNLASEETILQFTNPRAITSIATTPDGYIYFGVSGTGRHLKGGVYRVNSFGHK